MSNVCIDEKLLDAAGLSDFQELYAYVKERQSKPIGELPQPVPIGDQTLQQRLKNNDDIIYDSGDGSNEEFEPPVPNAITKLDLISLLERQSFLASSGSDPQLIVYGDKIPLTASNATTGLFPGGPDLIIGLYVELLPESVLKNLVCNIKPITISIKNYVITEVTANMAGYKATDTCHNRVRQFKRQRPFIVLALPVEIIVISNDCYINDLLFEAIDVFDDALTKPRNTVTRRLNPHSDFTSFLMTLQYQRNSYRAFTFDALDTPNQNTSVELRGAPIYHGATDSYYNVDTSGKRPPPPILCKVHDTFWLFLPAAGGSCIYDTNHSFDEIFGSLTG
ncbi:MAG: hypothetical protein EZS28_002712 [Streblomastix strix]|uniref:Uncharacterized protein n=1 Tax=Streblomastix strix TaxID=222440 RepID=A0A5J4X3I8_9EUKA|nr:MAG: hypothetical protein EZS28_002712 [Streblomastix strix]